MPLDPQKIDRAKRLFDSTRKGDVWTTRNKILAVLALLYLISPVDLIPDWVVPFIGLLDDLGIGAAVAFWIRTHRAPTTPHDPPQRNDERT